MGDRQRSARIIVNVRSRAVVKVSSDNAVLDRNRRIDVADGSSIAGVSVISRERTLAHHHRAVEPPDGSAVGIGACREVAGKRALTNRHELTVNRPAGGSAVSGREVGGESTLANGHAAIDSRSRNGPAVCIKTRR